MLQKILDIYNIVISKIKKYEIIIILSLLCGFLFTCLCYQINKNFVLKRTMNNNIVALTDSIDYYKSKNGELIATKALLEGDLKTLKLANDSLYQIIKDMKLKDPTTVVRVVSSIDNPKLDTCFVVLHDTIQSEFKKPFNFNNEYRSLEGYVSHSDSILGLSITKDEVYFDYTIAVENSKVYITSSNPYVKYKEVTGIVQTSDTKKKNWSLGIGPTLNIGYDLNGKKIVPTVGLGINLQYNLLQW